MLFITANQYAFLSMNGRMSALLFVQLFFALCLIKDLFHLKLVSESM